ncbi:hypothetical protein [Candidatus Enterovibrio escicola]|uniref:hypothetical protein n=1 Tax=Candidatus Enterovibrio escicola TaxID=1927127 RepID=UPI0012382501|nr:hypothetical protein [Candidatus Enterovibrio escacola]
MKTISIAEFETLVARNDWQREQDCEVLKRLDRQVEEWNEENESFDLNDIPHVFGLASKTSTLDGIKITYTEGFNYDECDSDSLSTGTEGQDTVWSVESVTVVDEDGDELNAHELAYYLDSDSSSIHYSVLEIEQIIDVNEDSDMETFTLDIDNAPNVLFTGELVANTASSDNQAIGSSYNDQTGRWTELSLYKTKGGKFICHQVARTRRQDERDHFSGKVCETLEAVKEFFGHRWLSKELYAKASIDDVVEVE